MDERVIEIIARNLNLDSIKIEDGTIKVGFNETPEWDSLAHLSIMADLEDEFDIEIDIDEMYQLTNVSKIVGYLSKV